MRYVKRYRNEFVQDGHGRSEALRWPMLLLPDDIEARAESLYLDASLDPGCPVSTFDLATRLLGPSSVRCVDRWALYAFGAVIHVGTAWRIVLRRDLPDYSARHIVGHELAHWYFRTAGIIGDEEDADWLGAALMLPRQATGLSDHGLLGAVRVTQIWKARSGVRWQTTHGIARVERAKHRYELVTRPCCALVKFEGQGVIQKLVG